MRHFESVTSQTLNYLRQNPGVRNCLARGLINYSALAREICKSIGDDNFNAVVAACRRFKAKTKRSAEAEKAIVKLLKSSRLRIKNKMSVVIVDKPRDFEVIFALQRRIRKLRGSFQFLEGEEVVTLVLETQELSHVRTAFAGRIKRITNGLAQILMIFSDDLEITPGVLSHIYALLGANGINVVEEMSCWTDVMLVVAEKDVTMATQLLG